MSSSVTCVRRNWSEVYRSKFLFIATFTIVAASGCGQSTDQITRTEDRLERPTLSKVAETPGDVGDDRALPITTVSNAVDVNQLVEQIELPDLPEQINFFEPPTASTLKVEVASPKQNEQQTVRLIGFVSQGSQSSEDAIALVKVGERLVPLQSGESFESIKLLSVDLEKRAATIQLPRERLTLMMMDQPIVNRPSGGSVGPLFTKRQGPSSDRHDADFPEELDEGFTDSMFEPPDLPELAPPPMPEESAVEIPEAFELPELPDLPSIDELIAPL